MILIDALYVNNGGGVVLLKYLVEEIEKYKMDVFYLFDERSVEYFKNISKSKKKLCEATLLNRYNFYKRHKYKFNKVFCFGNVPPLLRLNAKVYTYFHNALFFERTSYLNLRSKMLLMLKGAFIKCLKNNTNFWIVQSNNVRRGIYEWLKISDKVLVIPFFEENKIINNVKKIKNSFLYVSSGAPHKNHFRLLNAWLKLKKKGYELELNLTLSDKFPGILNKIDQLKIQGVNIKNHGFLDREELKLLYSSCEYQIFPSLSESFGLGLLEGATHYCKTIASDLPYTYEVVEPHITFDPYNEDSIVDSVVTSLKIQDVITKIRIKNRIQDLIEILK